MKTFCIALGGNLGASEESFQEGLSFLKKHGAALNAMSSIYKSRPMGQHAGGQFTNAVALIDFSGSPQELMSILHRAESDAGRVRDVFWGPRTLDLDLICLDQEIIQTDQLVLPHPLMWYRWFVLKPMNELLPDWQHPALLQTTTELLDQIQRRPILLHIPDSTQNDRALLHDWQADQTADVRLDFSEESSALSTAYVRICTETRPRQPPLESDRVIRAYSEKGLTTEMDAIRDAMLEQNDTRTMPQ